MPYATQAEVEDYMGVSLEGEPQAIAFVIREAGKDIDAYIGNRFEYQSDGTQFGDLTTTPYANPHDLTDHQIIRLRDATSAQVEYRLQMGYDFFVEDQRERVSGPDITEDGRVGRVGPKARRELSGMSLIRLTGRIV